MTCFQERSPLLFITRFTNSILKLDAWVEKHSSLRSFIEPLFEGIVTVLVLDSGRNREHATFACHAGMEVIRSGEINEAVP